MKKGLIATFMVALMLLTVLSAVSSANDISVSKEILRKNDSNYLQQNKELTGEHLIYLIYSYFFTGLKYLKYKPVIRRIIFEIIEDGNATYDEVQEIVNISNLDIEQTYILADVKTKEDTDGYISCFPGFFKSWFDIYHAKGCFLSYDPADLPWKGWHLQINGKTISEKPGYIFGFFGDADLCYTEMPPDSMFTFILDGYGLLIFHGV